MLKSNQTYCPNFGGNSRHHKGAKSQNVHIYPNPANDILMVEFQELNRKIKFRLLNIRGEVMKLAFVEPNQKQIQLDIENLSSGLYFIEIFDDNHTIKKIVIK